jgi:hypothetical protein
MFRKLALALAATATISAAALAPTSASAGHKHWHWGYGAAAFGAGLATSAILAGGYHGGYGPSCYRVKRWVPTPYGPKLRKFWVC